jgi:hypothetical protein
LPPELRNGFDVIESPTAAYGRRRFRGKASLGERKQPRGSYEHKLRDAPTIGQLRKQTRDAAFAESGLVLIEDVSVAQFQSESREERSVAGEANSAVSHELIDSKADCLPGPDPPRGNDGQIGIRRRISGSGFAQPGNGDRRGLQIETHSPGGNDGTAMLQ